MPGSLDDGASVFSTDVLDTCDKNESTSVKTDWQLNNGQSDAILQIEAKIGVGVNGGSGDLVTRLSVSDSKVTSHSTEISTNLSASGSKDVSQSTIISANLSTGDSKDLSQSALLSTTESKVASAH